MLSTRTMVPRADREVDPFIFIGESISLEKELSVPLRIVDNVYLDRAGRAYLDIIKTKLHGNFLSNQFHGYFNIHEQKCVKEADGKSARTFDCEESEWEYWIIRHLNFCSEPNIEIALELFDSPLTPIFSAFGPVSGKLFPEVPAAYYQNRFGIDNVQINNTNLETFRKVYSLLEHFESVSDDYPILDKAIQDYVKLKTISERSPFRIVAIFSILEMILTTNYSGQNGPSISHQLKYKIPLTNNLFEKPLDFTEYFKGPDTLTIGKIIEKMYHFRSAIAHGSSIDFRSELQILNSKDNVLRFLHEFLRKLIVYSLSNPDLIRDLKPC